MLQRVSTEAEIGGILLSYLKEEECLTTQRLDLERELPRPFLVAWHPLPRLSSAALLRTLRGHIFSVKGCGFSPDGKWIVSASSDRTLKVWEAATGEERLTLTGHASGVKGCGFSPDGKWIVSASKDGTLKLWDAATGAEVRTLTGHTREVHAGAFSPDGKMIVSTSRDGTLKVWDAATGTEFHTLTRLTDPVYTCVVSPDGKWIIASSDYGTLRVWETATGQKVLTFLIDEALSACAFHPDGEHLVISGKLGMYFLRLVQ